MRAAMHFSRCVLAALVAVPVRSACAQVNTAQSSGWLDRDQVTKLFSLQFDVVGAWEPFQLIAITWPGESITIDHVYNAQRAPGGDGSTTIVRLGRTATNPPNFVLMGKGSMSRAPVISCNAADSHNLPPPSPPHEADCPLQPKYKTVNTWIGNDQTGAGDNVEIKFATWRDAGLVRLRFWGQTGMQVEGPVGATVFSTVVNSGDTLITMQLGTSCEDRVVDSAGIVVAQPGQQTNCVPHRAETMHVTFNLKPPALHPPQIECHEFSPPPPPRPAAIAAVDGFQLTHPSDAAASSQISGWAPTSRAPPSPPAPPPPPPSPPPALVMGSVLESLDDCALGVKAVVVHVESHSSMPTYRIELQPEYWVDGYVFILGVTGSQIDLGQEVVSRTTRLRKAHARGAPRLLLSQRRSTPAAALKCCVRRSTPLCCSLPSTQQAASCSSAFKWAKCLAAEARQAYRSRSLDAASSSASSRADLHRHRHPACTAP